MKYKMAEYDEKVKEMTVDTQLQILQITTESGRNYVVKVDGTE